MAAAAPHVHVLLVEDEARLATMIQRGLEHLGYQVTLAGDGVTALAATTEAEHDVIVMDIGIPQPDGLTVLRQLRDRGDKRPILLLTGRSGVSDRVAGLRAGADDYLPKPFVLDELSARVDALLRRTRPDPATVLTSGSLELDPAGRTAYRAGTPVDLTEREFDLLELLVRNPRRVLTRDQILDRVFAMPDGGASNLVAVYVKYLRDKVDRPFGTESLVTVRGHGYRWDPDADA